MPWLEASGGMWVAMGGLWKAIILVSGLALQMLFPLLATSAIEAVRGRRPRRKSPRTATGSVFSEPTMPKEAR